MVKFLTVHTFTSSFFNPLTFAMAFTSFQISFTTDSPLLQSLY